MLEIDYIGNSACQSERCISDILAAQAERRSRAIAVVAPGSRPLTYGRLLEQVHYVVEELNGMGVGRGDRVGIVVPNGPEMAVAFLSISAGAISAPLNPAYREPEFDFYLSDLNAKALVIQDDLDSPARLVARQRGIPIITLRPGIDDEAGIFKLGGPAGRRDQGRGGYAGESDVALVLHTSGTTSRPKIVPLTHSNICASSRNIIATLGLNAADRCLNVMPLFHIHGLIAATLSSIFAGASVVCTQGFNPTGFFGDLEEFRPTWYTAVPTIHQTILARARSNRDVSQHSSLRFIRSSSSALPPPVMADMEALFGVPVIEAYGMTEASHQMASNPLPPLMRKPGSVGVAAGPDVAVMDEDGHLLLAGQLGEIVIRGANVTSGYEANPTANENAFTNGWFRTGDQGHMDEDGYIFLAGRLKEIINRGGEKISPREVDDVLMGHPAIQQVVTFAAPHTWLGEEVACAIVLRKGASVTEREVREFASSRLTEFKVPRRIIFLDEIPKGATGKLQRIGLADKLGLKPLGTENRNNGRPYVPPKDALEAQLIKIWEEVLAVNGVGVRDDFFDLGGYSALAIQLIETISKRLGKELSPATLLRAANVEQQAEILRHDGLSDSLSSIVAVQPFGSKPPMFCVHEVGGYLYYRDLANHLGSDQPLFGLQPRGLDGNCPLLESIEQMAAHYVSEVRSVRPQGPYFLAGFSFGGVVAFEMARQIEAQGGKVALLAMFDSYTPEYSWTLDRVRSRARIGRSSGPSCSGSNEAPKLTRLWNWTRRHIKAMRALPPGKHLEYLSERARGLIRARLEALSARTINKAKKMAWNVEYSYYRAIGRSYPRAYRFVADVNRRALRAYVAQPYSGSLCLFCSTRPPDELDLDPDLGWGGLVQGDFERYEIPGSHRSIVREPSVRILADELGACLERAITSMDQVPSGAPSVIARGKTIAS